MLGSLAAPTAVDYNEAQDKPQEIKEEDAIPRMTSTDSDGEDHSTESTDSECAQLPEAERVFINEVKVGVHNPDPHWESDGSDNETQVLDEVSTAVAPAAALLQTRLPQAQRARPAQPKRRANEKRGFWEFVNRTLGGALDGALDGSATQPASPSSLHPAQGIQTRPVKGCRQNVKACQLKPLAPPGKLEVFKWQERGSATRPASSHCAETSIYGYIHKFGQAASRTDQPETKNDILERRKLTVTSETDGMECDTSENLVNNDVVPPHALLHSLP